MGEGWGLRRARIKMQRMCTYAQCRYVLQQQRAVVTRLSGIAAAIGRRDER